MQQVQAAAAANVPLDAVVAEVLPIPIPQSGTTSDRQDTTQGGLKIGTTGGSTCSLGFNFTRWGPSQYMMTAGHCTPPIGSVNTGTYVSQPYVYTQEAQEFGDPPASSSVTGCLSPDLCRNADATQFWWRFSPQTFGIGLISAPEPGTASSTWGVMAGTDAYTYFDIVGEAPDSWLLFGTQVSKVGYATGLTRGTITQTCVYYEEYNTNGAAIPCTMMTNYPAASGDSGGAILYGWPEPQTPPAGTSVYLAGLSTFGASEIQTSGFSTWSGIVRDFGNLMTYPGKPCC